MSSSISISSSLTARSVAPVNPFAFPFGSGQIDRDAFKDPIQCSYVSFIGAPGSLEHRPPSMCHISPPASYDLKTARREPLFSVKPTLQRLDIARARENEIEEIQPFTPGALDKVKGWSSCRGWPVVQNTPRAQSDEKPSADKDSTPTNKRPRRLSTHHGDVEALEHLQEVCSGDPALLEIMNNSAQEARNARRPEGPESQPDEQAIKEMGFLTT